MKRREGTKPLSKDSSPWGENRLRGSLKGRSPFKKSPSPSPLKERGIKGVR